MKIRFSSFAGMCLLSLCLIWSASAQSVKPGTEIQVQLLTPLDTGSAHAGQEFTATLAQAVVAGKVVWPKGSPVKGKVLEAVSSGRLERPASITLQLTQIGTVPVSTEPEEIGGKSHAGRNVALIGGGAGAGAILGGIAGGGKGAVIGAAAGAGAGTLAAAATGKHEIVLRAETLLLFAVPGGPAAPPPPPPQQPAPAQTVYHPEASERPDPGYRREDDRPEEADPRLAHREYRDHDRDEDRYEDRYEDRGEERYEDRRDYADREYRDADHPRRFRVYFSDRDEDVIRHYFRSDRDGRRLPPGLAKRNGDLPPGLEKQLRRNGTLPPGLQRRVEPFPAELDRRLEPLPREYSRVILSGRAMILRDGDEIVDMMFIDE